MSNENIVIVQDLEKKYKSGTHAVKGINFNVRKGEIFGMLGPNGAGKTTTLQMMGTLLGITEGKIKILDYDVSTESSLVRENIGFALQEAGLDSLSTVRELIAFHVKLFGFRGVEIQERVEQSLSLLDLHEYSDQMIPELSGGTQRRLDLAVSLVHDPKLLILDEPTTGLDPAHRADLWSLLKKLKNEKGITIVMSTHYMEEADFLCDRLAIIDSGEIVAIDTPQKLKKTIGKDRIEFKLFESLDEGQIRLVKERFDEADVSIEESYFTIRVGDGEEALLDTLKSIIDMDVKVKGTKVLRPTLDDVYLKYTGKRLEEV
ncbi:MAG: daunorubicin resistance protein DrrA family ABC transporter ATP-binding protein [Methanobacteriota archaeon]|jgi:ABC-2 type transport system ATP-binding protein|nr:MAG: daunorubicin resistance protein DrrA family ABC transporter ATP-binding protein [Euryarchaeota archaeon]|tara:strand:- start:353 stop:1306 length:954 start_codon:yes stop_codon:yes gene_type:complete